MPIATPLLQLPPGTFNFLHITTKGIRRKNTRGLREACAYVSKRLPDARLIIKSIQDPHYSLAPPEGSAGRHHRPP